MESIYLLTSFVPRTYKKWIFIFLNILAFYLLAIFGKTNIHKYSIIIIGFILALFVAFSFKKFLFILKQKMKAKNIKGNLNDFYLSMFLLGIGYGLILILENYALLPGPEQQTIINWFIVIYPIFVIAQQFLYMIEPNIIFRDQSILFRLIYCSVCFGMAHIFYSFDVVIYAFILVGFPCAVLSVIRNNIFVSISYHLIIGPIGLYLQYV